MQHLVTPALARAAGPELRGLPAEAEVGAVRRPVRAVRLHTALPRVRVRGGAVPAIGVPSTLLSELASTLSLAYPASGLQ